MSVNADSATVAAVDSNQSWPARARALAPKIAAAAAAIERTQLLPNTLLDTLFEAKLFRMLLPRAFGGSEIGPVPFVQTIEEIAKADASTAWCIGQASGCSFSAAYLAPAVAAQIFDDPRAVVAWGPATHHSRAIVVDGGYRVTGSWKYASGSRHATWLGAHCAVFETDGSPRLNANGKQLEKTMLFPRAAAQIEDVWQVMGLCGTGSDNYGLTDHFIPESFTYERDADRDRRETGPLYRFGILTTYGMAFSAIALGLARSSLDAFVTLAAEKIPHSSARPLRENSVIQAQVAVAEAKLGSSRLFLHQTIDDLWNTLLRGDRLSLDQRARFRMAVTYAMQQAREVVDMAYTAAGASAIFEKNPFERRFRDMHVVSQQIQAHASNFETVGQVLLGIGGANLRI